MSVTVHQPSEALAKANQIRLARSALKRSIGAQPLAESILAAARVVADPPPEARTMALGELLRSIRRFGPDRARRILAAHMISDRRRLCDLTERQRTALADELTEIAASR